ncbi:MAG: butyrate kinase [Bacteroidales bacterium]|jgi:butyrate kinase|nr:butyrate kinase [Bacteroidales bacterium]
MTQKEKVKVLAINPGSTSTKVAVMEINMNTSEEKEIIKSIFSINIKHDTKKIDTFVHITDQYQWRKQCVLDELQLNHVNISEIEYIIGRGGLIRNIPSGIYRINDVMLEDLKTGYNGEHASNLGGLIADDIAKHCGVEAFIADPVVVDEMEAIAKVSGHPLFDRKSIFHALNQKAIARTYAKQKEEKYENLHLIVVHLGGGISVGAHRKGLVVDVNQALNGEGAFSPERSGTLPVGDLIKLCFSGKYTEQEINKMVVGKGGYVAYLGTNDALEIEKRIEAGDIEAKFYSEAMAYQIAKEIGAASTVLEGKVDAILFTGGMAYDKRFIATIEKRIRHITSEIKLFPGEDEMRALAFNIYLMLKGEIPCKEYR